MTNKMDKLFIALSSPDGVFQGYVKSVSKANQRVYSTKNKYDAKAYAKRETAEKDANLILQMTHGGLICTLG